MGTIISGSGFSCGALSPLQVCGVWFSLGCIFDRVLGVIIK